MSKTITFPKQLKKICVFLIVCLIALTLTSCDSTNRKSNGDLNLNATYASAGNVSVSVGELWNSLRYNSVDYITNEATKFMYAKEIETVKANAASYSEKFEEIILKAIYDTDDADEIADMKAATKTASEKQFVDKMYSNGYTITLDQVRNKEFTSIYPYYYLDVAKYVGAKNKLTEEFTVENGSIKFGEINDESFFTASSVISYYKNNYVNQGNASALLIRFVSATESNNVLKKFGIKAYDGEWYQIKIDDTCTTKAKYEEYYDNYTVNPTGTDGIRSIAETGNGAATVLKVYIAVYNYIYTYRDKISWNASTDMFADFDAAYTGEDFLEYYNYISKIIAEDEATTVTAEDEYNQLVTVLNQYDAAMKAQDSTWEIINMSNERLNKYNSSLATYVYETLQHKESEEGAGYTQYSTTSKTYGDFSYLVFKLGQDEDPVLYDEENWEKYTDSDDDTEVDYATLFTNQTLLQEILEKMFDEYIDDSYISDVLTERVKDAKLYIYDSTVELQFMYSTDENIFKDTYEKTKKANNKEIAAIKYNGEWKGITVADAYSYLEPLYGPTQALALLFDAYIKTTSYYTDLESKYDDYKTQIENMLYYFANDQYSSYGYPSSMGKYNFMMVYYRTANINDAIRNYLMLSAAESAFYTDFAAHGFTGDTFYEKLVNFSTTAYNDYYSMTATAIKVYTDMDEDGEPDTLDAVDDAATLTKAAALLAEVKKAVLNSTGDYATALSDVITEYNSSSRMTSDNPTTSDYKWSEYRHAGLYITTESLDAITDTTTTADDDIQARLEALYGTAGIMSPTYGFGANLYDSELIQTETGYTQLLITAGANPSSAKYDDADGIYAIAKTIFNDTVTTITFADFTSKVATIDEVKVYVSDYLLWGDVYQLPEATTTALDAFILPLLERYTSTVSKFIIINDLLGTVTFASTDAFTATSDATFAANYNRATFLANYLTSLQNNTDGYLDNPQYAGWWTTMYN